MDSLRKVFAYRLKEIRGNRTQPEFAEFLDLSLRTYQELEAGNIPQRKTVAKLVEKLGLQSETPLFLDPDLIPSAPVPTPTEALQVLARAIEAPAAQDPLLKKVAELGPNGRRQLEKSLDVYQRADANKDSLTNRAKGE